MKKEMRELLRKKPKTLLKEDGSALFMQRK